MSVTVEAQRDEALVLWEMGAASVQARLEEMALDVCGMLPRLVGTEPDRAFHLTTSDLPLPGGQKLRLSVSARVLSE